MARKAVTDMEGVEASAKGKKKKLETRIISTLLLDDASNPAASKRILPMFVPEQETANSVPLYCDYNRHQMACWDTFLADI